MAEDVEAGRGVHGRGHGARVERIADPQGGLEGAGGDACFGAFGNEVEDGRACGFGAGAGGGGDGDEGGERTFDGEAEAEGGVDKVEEGGVGVSVIEVHQFGCVDDGAAADGEESGGVVGFGEVDGFLDAGVGVSWGGGRNCRVCLRVLGALTSCLLALPLRFRTRRTRCFPFADPRQLASSHPTLPRSRPLRHTLSSLPCS